MTEIVAPASIGNVGPGFDALSVAVQLYLRVSVLDIDRQAVDTFVTEFDGPAPAGGNGIERAFRRVRELAGVPAPGVRIRVTSDIPVCAGLGSSAAATIAGFRLYDAVASPLDEEWMLALGCQLEGHPDNTSACLLGGLTASCCLEDGRVIAHSLPWPESIVFVVATPDLPLPTKVARGVLPASIPLEDAVFNLQRALQLVCAVQSGRIGNLRHALRDRWHQPARAALVPALREALAIEDDAVIGALLSGAGPSIVVLAEDRNERQAAAALQDVYRRLGVRAAIRTLRAHQPAAQSISHVID
jgi:homoserine kinase